jgi:signal transduction histidine kinase
VTTDACHLCRRGMLSVLAHELRNPLSALGNSLYVLKWSQPGDPKAQRAMTVIERQIGHLSKLITSLTDAARINQGMVELRRIVLDLCATLRSCASQHEEHFSRHDIKLDLRVPDQPIFVSADPLRLDEILAKLLDNATRFTPAGGRVSLGVEADQGSRLARIRVQDSGAGLDEPTRARLFEPFTQADTSLARSHGGLGLGLAVVKGLVELHGGSVRGESDGPGMGSVFTVELPLAADPLTSTTTVP